MNRTTPSPHPTRLIGVCFVAIGLFGALLATGARLQAAPTTPTATIYDDDVDSKKQTTIYVSGAGSTVTLADIQSAVAATSTTYLVNEGGGIWQLNVNLIIGNGVTLNLSPATGVTELRLRSDTNRVVTAEQRIMDSNAPAAPAAIKYNTFVYVKGESSTINIESIKVYSWDEGAQQVDQDETNGRAYLLAKYASTMTIRNADIGYLGSKDGESYGIAWRDVGEANGAFITRVTGEVINSKIHHNYYGIYTYQAQNMTFRGNEFYENIRYGFDPHDYSHHFVVEDNDAHHNGAHGFIISRGCNNFVFRNNRSYNNADPGSNLAHGFMLDPGGADIDKPQVSSSENLLENNVAYENEGYGFRILGSSDNTVRDNNFYHNEMGISIDSDSNRNRLESNRIEENNRYGFYIRDNQANELIANQINRNGSDGVNISTSAKNNQLVRNSIAANGDYGIAISGSSTTGNSWSQNSIVDNVNGGIEDQVRKISAPQLLSTVNNRIDGSAKAGATVELFANDSATMQGARYIGATTADSNGSFTYVTTSGWGGAYITAIALDSSGNGSTFSEPLAVSGSVVPTATATLAATSTASATTTPIPTGTTSATATPTLTASPTVTDTPTPVTPTATTVPGTIATPTATTTSTPINTVTATPTPITTPGGTGTTERTYLPLILGQ